MKLIFLDIDGVLINGNHIREHGNPRRADPVCVQNLQSILDATLAKIIVSSSWRINKPLSLLKDSLMKAGIPTESIIGKTPQMSNGHRGMEIKAYLLRNYTLTPTYVIIDDDSDFFPEQLPKHVKTEFAYGLDITATNRAIDILGNKF
jgi:hypothetical protein